MVPRLGPRLTGESEDLEQNPGVAGRERERECVCVCACACVFWEEHAVWMTRL